MNQKIDELTKKKETAELAQKTLISLFLQNQINPHFLYIIRLKLSAELLTVLCGYHKKLLQCSYPRMFRYNLEGFEYGNTGAGTGTKQILYLYHAASV